MTRAISTSWLCLFLEKNTIIIIIINLMNDPKSRRKHQRHWISIKLIAAMAEWELISESKVIRSFKKRISIHWDTATMLNSSSIANSIETPIIPPRLVPFCNGSAMWDYEIEAFMKDQPNFTKIEELGQFNYCDYVQFFHLWRIMQETSMSLGDHEDAKKLAFWLCPFLIVICLFSIIFNGSIVIVSRRNNRNKTPVSLLTLNLAFTDLISSSLNALNLSIFTFIEEGLGYSNLISGCQQLVIETFRATSMMASALHLLALAFVHLQCISEPFLSRWVFQN